MNEELNINDIFDISTDKMKGYILKYIQKLIFET